MVSNSLLQIRGCVTKSLLLLAMCAAALVGSGCGDTVSDRDIVKASLAETRALLQDKPGAAKAIDVRPSTNYAAAHIPGAVNLDLGSVSERKDSIDPALAKYKTLVVYGADPGSGSASAMVKRLLRAGHKNVRLFSGGMAEWTGSGLRTEGAGAPPPPPAR